MRGKKRILVEAGKLDIKTKLFLGIDMRDFLRQIRDKLAPQNLIK